MTRKLLFIAGILAVAWIFVPAIHTGATEIAFEPGDPDPNTYTRETHLGAPMAWVEIGVAHNELHTPPDSHSFRFDGVNLLIHLVVVAVPFALRSLLGKRTGSGRASPSD